MCVCVCVCVCVCAQEVAYSHANLSILHTSCGRNNTLTAIQVLTILHTLFGRRMLILAEFSFIIPNTFVGKINMFAPKALGS